MVRIALLAALAATTALSASSAIAQVNLDDRIVEADQQPRSGRQFQQGVGHDIRRLAFDQLAALPAVRLTDARPQQTQIVVNLRGRPNRRSRITNAVLLPDGDGRRDAVDGIDIRLLHPLEELPGVGGQGLHVSPLPLGIDGVEGQR